MSLPACQQLRLSFEKHPAGRSQVRLPSFQGRIIIALSSARRLILDHTRAFGKRFDSDRPGRVDPFEVIRNIRLGITLPRVKFGCGRPTRSDIRHPSAPEPRAAARHAADQAAPRRHDRASGCAHAHLIGQPPAAMRAELDNHHAAHQAPDSGASAIGRCDPAGRKKCAADSHDLHRG